MCLGLTLVETRGEKIKTRSDKLTACPRLAKQQEKRYQGREYSSGHRSKTLTIFEFQQCHHEMGHGKQRVRHKGPQMATRHGWETEKTAQIKEGVGNFQEFRT